MLAIKEEVGREDRLRSTNVGLIEDESNGLIANEFIDEVRVRAASTESETFRSQALKILDTYNARLGKTGPSQF